MTPNPRLQRTRRRAPLNRKLLGNTGTVSLRLMSRQLAGCVVLLCFTAASCVTTDVTRSYAASEPSRLSVSAYWSPSAAHRRRPLDVPVHTRLFRLDLDSPILIRESQESSWSIPAVAPGRYRLDVMGWQRSNGKVTHFRSPRSETFSVASAERLEIHVILSDKRGWLWAALGLVLSGMGIEIIPRHTK